LEAHGVEERAMAAVFDGGILGYVHDPGAQAGAAKVFREPQNVDGEPSESEFAEQAAHYLAVRIANVDIQVAEGMAAEVRSVEFLQAASDQSAALGLDLMGYLKLE
jgi:hypothetical protein